MTLDFLNDFSVLILDESSTLQDLLSDWISPVPTKTVSSANSIPSEFDSTVIVTCLSQTALKNESDSVQKYILNRNPYCQIIGVIPRSSFVSPYEDEFDEILQRPLFKDEFQQTIEYRFIAGAYTTMLSEFYDINSTLVALLRASDGDVDARNDSTAELQDRYNVLKKRLDTLQENLASDTILNILQTIERHNQYLTTPDIDTDEGRETKFRSRRCPSCKLPWGVDHRNDLGVGFEKLGADVFQCTRCDKIVHGLAGEQRVL